ncbi:MAG: hypothetical protein IKO83_04640 [Oscillospiraceae bacterium]|nr:hypothetical protein [Oscillospiraceae bacterium]
MKSEDFMDALTEVDERYLCETLARMETPVHVRPRRRLVRSLLLAAVLILLLAPAAWAAYTHYMSARVPEGALHFTSIDDENKLLEGSLPNVAMVVNVDTRPESTDVLLRFGWLPEGAPAPSELYCGDDPSYYGMLDFFHDHDRWPGWERRSLDELLEEAGMTADEAKSWYGGYNWETADRALLHIQVFSAAELYKRDLLLGTYGGKSRIVFEGERGKYEMLEIQIDYREMYQRLFEKNGYMAPEVEWFKNYLFLLEPEEQYLIFIGGSDTAFPFKTLERIADNLEVRITGFPAHAGWEEHSFLLLDLGRG